MTQAKTATSPEQTDRRIDPLAFYVKGLPKTQGSFFVVKGRLIQSNPHDLKAWRQAIADLAMLRSGTDVFPLWPEGGIDVRLDFYLPRGKSVKRARPTVKPDGDKLERAVWDALTGIAYADDSQIIEWGGGKYYAGGDMFEGSTGFAEPGVFVNVQPLI